MRNRHSCISIASHSVIQKDSFWKSKIREKILHWDGLSGDATQSLPNQVFNLNIAKDNVFNVEGTQVTIYHGKVMQLKVTNLIVPSASSIRLSDGHKQDTPLTLFTSGKKTDVPVLAATCLIRKGEKVYFCAYKQNAKADYADYMLPELFYQEKQQP